MGVISMSLSVVQEGVSLRSNAILIQKMHTPLRICESMSKHAGEKRSWTLLIVRRMPLKCEPKLSTPFCEMGQSPRPSRGKIKE